MIYEIGRLVSLLRSYDWVVLLLLFRFQVCIVLKRANSGLHCTVVPQYTEGSAKDWGSALVWNDCQNGELQNTEGSMGGHAHRARSRAKNTVAVRNWRPPVDYHTVKEMKEGSVNVRWSVLAPSFLSAMVGFVLKIYVRPHSQLATVLYSTLCPTSLMYCRLPQDFAWFRPCRSIPSALLRRHRTVALFRLNNCRRYLLLHGLRSPDRTEYDALPQPKQYRPAFFLSHPAVTSVEYVIVP